MNEERFKVLYIMKATGAIRTFTFDSFEDDKQNSRYIFHNHQTDFILTIHYHDVSSLITSLVYMRH